LVGGDGTQVLQVVLVANKHDDNVCIGVVMQLSQPTFDVLKRQVLGNIIDHQSSDSTTVVTAMSQPTLLTVLGISESESDGIGNPTLFQNPKSDGYLKSNCGGFEIFVLVQLYNYFRK